MVSHKSMGGLMLSIGAGGLRFKRKPGAFATCVGNKLRGEPGPTNGGRYDKGFQSRFSAAARSCSGGGGRRVKKE